MLVITWMLLHPRAYCLIKWIIGSTFGNADQNCVLFRIKEGFLFVVGNRMLVATGQWSNFDVPPKLGPFVYVNILLEFGLALFGAGSVLPLGRGIPIRQLLGPLGIFCL